MHLKIGQLNNGTAVYISNHSPNDHMALTGISGSGKTTCIKHIVKNNSSSERTTIIFDLDGRTFDIDDKEINYINAVEDGIALNLLDSSIVNADNDSYVNYVSYITDILSSVTLFGPRQQGCLREAIEYALKNREKYSSEMEAIIAGLELQVSNTAQSVYNKLWALLNCGIFRPSKKCIISGRINVISFEGVAPSTQRVLMEIVLGMLWKSIRFENRKTGKLNLVIDEFQNISLKKNSVIMEMLRESRKYGVSIILATQSITPFSKEILTHIHQTAIQLYFKPSTADIKKVANMIDSTNPEHWMLVLRNMHVGEAVATGNISINGHEFYKPVLIQSGYTPSSSSVLERRNLSCKK